MPVYEYAWKIANLRVLERRAGPKIGSSFCCILLFSAEISSLFACIENSMEKNLAGHGKCAQNTNI
jgi:hypothetical protein